MDQVQIPMEANEGIWRERCYARVESLKAKAHSPTSEHPFSNIFGEKYSTIIELQKAVQNENGDVNSFVDVLEKVCSKKKLLLSDIFDQVTPAGDSLLHEAAHFGRTNIVQLIGHHFPQLLTRRNMKLGDTPLHVAARAKSSEVINVILSQYSAHAQKSASSLENENEQITRLTNHHGNTALHEAVYSKHVDGVTLLFLADKCVTHYLNRSGQSSLYLAALTANKEIVYVLLEASFSDYKPLQYYHGNSPLHAAIYTKNAALIKEIVAKKPELIYLRDEDGGTPLHYAATHGYVEGVRMLLIKSPLSALERNRKGYLPIHLACKQGHIKVVKEFLEQEWTNDLRILVNKKGQNILHIAVKNGRYNVVNYLLRNTKLDVNEKDKDGNTPLHLASKNHFANILLSLTRDKRIDVNLNNNEGFTARDTFLLGADLERPMTQGERLSSYILRSAGARVSDKARDIHNGRLVTPKLEWIKGRVDTLMLVAILILTVTFAAGFTVPGSVYASDDPNPRDRGMAVLGNRTIFKIFVVFNTLATYCSTLGSLILLWAHSGDYYLARISFMYALEIVGIALVAMSLAFTAAVRLVVSNVSWLADLITVIGIIVLCLIISLQFLLFFPLGNLLPIVRQLSDLVISISVLLYRNPPEIKSKRRSNSKKDQYGGGPERQNSTSGIQD